MKKSEHYKEALSALEAEKKRIETNMSIIRKELIVAMNEESPFKIGEKVQFRNHPGGDWYIGIWGGYQRGWFGESVPAIFKIKKNGTASEKTYLVGINPEIMPA